MTANPYSSYPEFDDFECYHLPTDVITGFTDQEQMTTEYNDDEQGIIGPMIGQFLRGKPISRITLPSFILEPRSFLQKIGDFFNHSEFLEGINEKLPLERIFSVIKFYLSGFHVQAIGGCKKPYNALLGEYYHCKWKTESGRVPELLCEQTSHHPPVSSFCFSDNDLGISFTGSLLFKTSSKLMGFGIGAAVANEGVCELKLEKLNETYKITYPELWVHKIIAFGKMFMDVRGTTLIECDETGIKAEIYFKADDQVEVKIKQKYQSDGYESKSSYKVHGSWRNELELEDRKIEKGKRTPFMRIRDLNPPQRVHQPMWSQNPWESQRLWRHLTKALHISQRDDCEREKSKLENFQRALRSKREENNEDYVPRFFNFVTNEQFEYNGRKIEDLNHTKNYYPISSDLFSEHCIDSFDFISPLVSIDQCLEIEQNIMANANNL
eukprot:TRINITY_DN2933_c4_g4_i1.p1 TRINITY_DN2933_c4_g4~~TRINITY_DN2933_c4_g4_i1.p1  ORF type:complete len:439 (-),score=83.96 TRINITY_DN2933_c4_g4_i1:458-1774(-)